MMQQGILIETTGSFHAWTHCDPTTPFPGEFPAQAGDRLIDLSHLAQTDAQVVIGSARKLPPLERDALLADFPQVMLPTVGAPPPDHVARVQPGYRRIAHVPTQDWYEKEMTARLKANTRIAKGENADIVINEEFTHLSKNEKQIRKDMKNGVPFPLTPMVRLVERKKTLPDGSETIETVRQFSFHEPVAEF